MGSGRSALDIDLYQALEACADHLHRFGGHRQAAGLALKDSDLAQFKEAFDQAVRAQVGDGALMPRVAYDAQVPLQHVDKDMVRQIQALAPFGMGNPTPQVMCRNVQVQTARPVGNGKHLKMELSGSAQLDAIYFGVGSRGVTPPWTLMWCSSHPSTVIMAPKPRRRGAAARRRSPLLLSLSAKSLRYCRILHKPARIMNLVVVTPAAVARLRCPQGCCCSAAPSNSPEMQPSTRHFRAVYGQRPKAKCRCMQNPQTCRIPITRLSYAMAAFAPERLHWHTGRALWPCGHTGPSAAPDGMG